MSNTTTSHIADFYDTLPRTDEGILDLNGELGDYRKLTPEQKDLFQKVLSITDLSADGQHGTVWLDGEPLDSEGFHQYFACVLAGIEVLQDYEPELYLENETLFIAFKEMARSHSSSVIKSIKNGTK